MRHSSNNITSTLPKEIVCSGGSVGRAPLRAAIKYAFLPVFVQQYKNTREHLASGLYVKPIALFTAWRRRQGFRRNFIAALEFTLSNTMLLSASAALVWIVLGHSAVLCSAQGRMDSSLLFNANPAAYGTAFGPHVRVASAASDAPLVPDSVTVQAWIMPLPRDNAQTYTGPNDLGQIVGNMARTFSPSRIFAGFSLYCRDSSVRVYRCSFFVATSTSAFLEPTCNVPLHNWTHLSGVYDASTGVADLYANGSKCASSTSSTGPGPVSYFLRSTFVVGAWLEDAPGSARSSFYFTGRVDEVRVWAAARSRPQILSDMYDTISPATIAATPSLRLYLPCNERQDSVTVRDATGSFIPTLQPAGLAGGVPTFQPVAVDVGNSLATNFFLSAMDQPAAVRLRFGQQTPNASSGNTFVLEMQKANSLVIQAIDPNPSDLLQIGTPSFYPSVGGLPYGAVLQSQVLVAEAYSTPDLEGVVFARTLSWLPSFDSQWLIPPGGLPVSVPFTELASNPLAPATALPVRQRNDLIAFKLYVAAPPEFLSGPPLNSLPEVEIVTFIGRPVSFDVRARDRNMDEQLLLLVAYDPGLPNFATVSPPTSNGLGSVLVTRSFSWTPTCKQARRHTVVFEASSGGSKALQSVSVTVVSPAPILVDFDSSRLVTAPGCTVEVELTAADASLQVRALGLEAYSQEFSYNLSDVSVGQPPLQLPNSALTSVAGANALGGKSAFLRVFPEFVHGGRTYVACVSVKDACGLSSTYTRCRHILVQSCKVCARPGATLSSLAAQFGTDTGSLYAANTKLLNPDLIAVNSVVAIGGAHVSTEGQTLASVADFFQTSVEQLRHGNPSFASFGANATLSSGTSLCVISRICDLEQQCSAGGSCQN